VAATSAFYPSWDGKMSISFRANVDGECSLLAAYTGGLVAKADQLDPKFGSHRLLCCIHCMNWVNSCNALIMMTAP